MENTSDAPEDPSWAPKDEIAIRIDAHREAQAERARLDAIRQKRRRIMAFLIVIAAAGLGYTGWYFRSSIRKSGAPQPAAATAKMEVGQPVDAIEYMLTRASTTLPDGKSYELRRLEFDANRFLSGNATLDNADKFRATLSSESFRQEVKDAWLIVFAGASFDGDPEANRQLCRNRVTSVATTIKNTPGIAAKGFWGISAGEKAPPGTTPVSEKEENAIAARIPEAERRKQRALIIVAARATNPSGAAPPPDFIRQLSALLYHHGLLPSDYDAGTGEPVPLNLP